jgi:hypothetical protein
MVGFSLIDKEHKVVYNHYTKLVVRADLSASGERTTGFLFLLFMI